MALLALAARIGLHAEAGDAIGLTDAFEAEGEQAEGEAAAHAFVRAATLRDLVLHDARHAESLYRKALERCPGYPPAVDALEEMLRADGRWADLAAVLEQDLAALVRRPRMAAPTRETPRPRPRRSRAAGICWRRWSGSTAIASIGPRVRWSSSASGWRWTPGSSTRGCSRATWSCGRRSPRPMCRPAKPTAATPV